MVLVAMDSSGLLVPLLLLEAAALWWGWPSGAGHGWQRPPCAAAAAAAPGGGLVVVLAMDNMQNICETQAEFFRYCTMTSTSSLLQKNICETARQHAQPRLSFSVR